LLSIKNLNSIKNIIRFLNYYFKYHVNRKKSENFLQGWADVTII